MKKLLTATALTVALTLGLGASTASADPVWTHLGTYQHAGNVTEVVYSVADENGVTVFHDYWDFNTNDFLGGTHSSDPNPEGDGSGGTMTNAEIKETLQDLADKGAGAEFQEEVDFFETLFGKQLIEGGKTGSIVPYHNPAGGLLRDAEGGGGGMGGFDPNGGSLTEQLKKKRNSGKSTDEDDNKSNNPPPPNHGEVFPGPPELVNPVPILHKQRLTASPSPTAVAKIARK
jgi:hypothetical protein